MRIVDLETAQNLLHRVPRGPSLHQLSEQQPPPSSSHPPHQPGRGEPPYGGPPREQYGPPRSERVGGPKPDHYGPPHMRVSKCFFLTLGTLKL